MESLWSMVKRWFGAAQPPTEAIPVCEWEVEEQKRCRIYRGMFVVYGAEGRVVHGVLGRVVEWPGLPTDVYLRDPPAELRRHPKGPCLQLVSQDGPWFKLHWQKAARTFSESRAYVEQLLDEALRTERYKPRRALATRS